VPNATYDVTVLETHNGMFLSQTFQFIFRLTMAVHVVLSPGATIEDFKGLIAAQNRTNINIQVRDENYLELLIIVSQKFLISKILSIT